MVELRIDGTPLTEDCAGERVFYVPPSRPQDAEEGRISSFNERTVFVRYFGRDGLKSCAQATRPDDLTFDVGRYVATRKTGTCYGECISCERVLFVGDECEIKPGIRPPSVLYCAACASPIGGTR